MNEAQLEIQITNILRLMEQNTELIQQMNKLIRKIEIAYWVCGSALWLGILSVLGITIMRLTYHLVGK